MTTTITPEQAVELQRQALTDAYGEPAKFGGYEVWAQDPDGSTGEPSTSVDHNYGSRVFNYVRFDAEGDIESRWSMEAIAGEFR
jgi:hypothetical protein